MKTPEEIKRGLKMCGVIRGRCKGCPYDGETECVSNHSADALAYIQQLEAQVPKWISVEDGLPDGGYSVLCWYLSENGKYYCTTGNYLPIGGFWETDIDGNDGFYGCVKVTHWMPLPEPPKEG